MPSGEPLTKKRFPNGHPPSAPRNKPNGIHSTPRKRKKGFNEGEDSDDSTFEPAQPALGLSDDEDD